METCFVLGQPGHSLSATESRQELSWPHNPGTVVARLNGFVTSVPRREVRGEAAGPKPMLHTSPFVPGLLALPVGVGDTDVCTLGAGADLWALTPCDQKAPSKAALPKSQAD